MNDKQVAIEKARILKLRDKWLAIVGLGWWDVKFNYYRIDRPSNEDVSYTAKPRGYKPAMGTLSDPWYRTAHINFYMPQLMGMTDDELEECFLHECVHIVLSYMHSDDLGKEEELVATSIARAFVWTYNRGVSDSEAKIKPKKGKNDGNKS